MCQECDERNRKAKWMTRQQPRTSRAMFEGRRGLERIPCWRYLTDTGICCVTEITCPEQRDQQCQMWASSAIWDLARLVLWARPAVLELER